MIRANVAGAQPTLDEGRIQTAFISFSNIVDIVYRFMIIKVEQTSKVVGIYTYYSSILNQFPPFILCYPTVVSTVTIRINM